MRRRDFLRWASASAAGALLPVVGCSDSPAPADAGLLPDAGRPDSGAPDAGAPDSGAAPDAGARAKVLHYFTDFSRPEAVLGGGAAIALTTEDHGLARAELGACGLDLRFHLRDAASGAEDRPPGGGLYRMPADLDEAWITKGAVFDVDPRPLALDLVDAHTHPFGRGALGAIVHDPGPLPSLLSANGIGKALTMSDGPFADQLAFLAPLLAAHPALVPLLWIEPGRDSAAAAEPYLRDHGFRGLKFHPTISAYPADGSLMDPFLELARRYEVPVQLHTATDDPSRPARVAALARRFPEVRVVMVHTELGAADKGPALEAIRDLPNVFAETSWLNADEVLRAMSLLDSSRTLFGTDATVDGWEHFTKTSIADSSGTYTLRITDVVAQVRARAHPDAFANWARLTAIRLYGLRFRRA